MNLSRLRNNKIIPCAFKHENIDHVIPEFGDLFSTMWVLLHVLTGPGVITKDINTPLGFIRHLYAAMHLKEGALAFLGVVCSTWTTINRHWATGDIGLGHVHPNDLYMRIFKELT